MEFNQLTLDYLKQTSLSYRKKMGQYFTPQKIIVQLINQLYTSVKNPSVLDPSCGTGEFLLTAKKYWPNSRIVGWEIDPKLVKISKQLLAHANIQCIDSLKYKTDEKFDFVIGNPPYFEFLPDAFIREKYKDVIGGRVNIFSLFIKTSIDRLKPGGVLAFVVPPSMNNGVYYLKLRKYIIDNCNIEYLKIVNGANLFERAQQNIMLLVLKKGKNKSDFLVNTSTLRRCTSVCHNVTKDTIIFSENPEFLKKSFKNKKTLYQLGYRVKTGRFIWNQNKKLLTNNSKIGIPLIWSSNIGSSKLIFPIKDKKQFVLVGKYDIGPAILVNRIVGPVKNARLRAVLIPKGFKFVAENHVNVIYPSKNNVETGHAPTLRRIINKLQSKITLKLIHYITGNTQISKTELEQILSIF